MTTAVAPKPAYTPREVGAMLNPPRSGQYVRVRIHRGEIAATRLPGGDYEVPWQEVRRLTGQDLTAPGHEEHGADVKQREAVRELRRVLAEAQRLLAEIDG